MLLVSMLLLLLLHGTSGQSHNGYTLEMVADRTGCSSVHWLSVFVANPLDCIPSVLSSTSSGHCMSTPSNDGNIYFQHASYNDNNCGCATANCDANGRQTTGHNTVVMLYRLIELTSPPPPPPPPPVGSQGDPHLTLAHGARADFRGRHGGIFNFLSTYTLSANVRIVNTSFYLRPPPTYPNITVHGTMITDAYIVVRTSKGGWFNITYSADNVQGDHARRDVVTASCSFSQAASSPLSYLQPGDFKPCDSAFATLSFSTLEVHVVTTRNSWTLKVKSMPVYDRISGAHHRLDMVLNPITPEAQLVSMPHGIIGQSWDGDGRALGGALDEYPHTAGAIFTTSAMAEGAIEGVASDYEMPDPYAVAFKYSRFGKKGVGARNISSRVESTAVESTASSSAGALGDRFPRRNHVEL